MAAESSSHLKSGKRSLLSAWERNTKCCVTPAPRNWVLEGIPTPSMRDIYIVDFAVLRSNCGPSGPFTSERQITWPILRRNIGAQFRRS